MTDTDAPTTASAEQRVPEDVALTGSSWQQHEFDIDAYLRRIGVERARPDLELLERLHHAHVHTIPFATIDVLLGTHPGVAPAAVQRQLIDRRRGGYCFAHTQLFSAALEDLGFVVRRRLGRVGGSNRTRTHMSAEVRLGEQRLLVDPGFGSGITGPLSLEPGASRQEPGGEYTIQHADSEGVETWSLLRNGTSEHTVDALPVVPIDVRTGHLITSTDPSSGPFLHIPVAMKHTAEGHVSVAGSSRTVRRQGQPTRREELSSAELVEAVRDLDVRLDHEEAVRLRSVVDGLRRSPAARG